MKSKSKTLWILTVLAALLLVVGACSADPDAEETASGEETNEDGSENEEVDGEPREGGDLIIASSGSPTMFNPLYTSDTNSGITEDFIFNGLTKTDPEAETEGVLAEDWEYNDDGTVLTFHLRDDVNFHDGEPMTAEDVEFTYSIPLDDDYSGPRSSYFKSVESVEATDDYTVEVTLKQPDATFLTKSTSYGILPKHILGDVPISELGKDEFNTEDPIGTGPFKFVEWKQGQNVQVEANEDYFEGRPNFDTITQKIVDDSNAMLAQFQAGDIDYIGVSSDNLTSAQALVDGGEAEMESILGSSYTYISYNQRNPLFEDKEVRQALTQALDREKFIDTVMEGNGEIANHPGFKNSWAFNEDVPTFDYDPEKAKEKLADAGWDDKNDDDILINEDGEEFAFTLKVQQGNTVRQKLAEYAQEQWLDLGINVDLNVVEWSAFLKQIKAPNWDFDAHVLGLSASLEPSLTSIYHSREIEDGFNREAYENDELDELMDESDQEPDDDKRAEMIKEAQAIIAEDQPFTFFFFGNNNYIHHGDIKDIQLHPKDKYYNIDEWWMEQ